MQFYSPTGAAAVRPGLADYGYPSAAAAAAANQRMNWPPALHPGAWPYDYAAYSAAAYPPAGIEVRSPSAYNISSPTGLSPHSQQPSSTDQNGATRHNIADILGGQTQNPLQSEIAKTGGAGYQKSPTSTTAHNMFSPTTEHIRSPTTPTHPHSGMVYHHHTGAGEVPANFYIPAALPRGFPGR